LEPHKTGPATSPWCVNVPARISESGKRERKFFVSKSEAETYSKAYLVRLEKTRAETAQRSNAEKRDAAIEHTRAGLAACRKLGIVDEVQYLDFAKAIAEQSPEILVHFIKNYVEEDFDFTGDAEG
jgi:hypothetical protein